jgi:hypothetical protein
LYACILCLCTSCMRTYTHPLKYMSPASSGGRSALLSNALHKCR